MSWSKKKVTRSRFLSMVKIINLGVIAVMVLQALAYDATQAKQECTIVVLFMVVNK